MPELPEVETWRRLAHRTAVDQTIEQAFCAEDDIIYDRNSPAAVAKILQGQKVIGTSRKGKHCWLDLENGQDLYLHFGMTGSLWWLQPGEPEPSHLKLRLELSDGNRLVYRNLRRIGKIRLLDDAAAVPPVSRLGPDPLGDSFPLADLQAQLAKRKAPVKAVLLDQKVFAGVGNWIADEVCYQAHLNPHTKCDQLTSNQVRELRNSLLKILKKAVAVDADADRFPKNWLFHYRWGKKAECDAKGQKILFEQIGGRTTAWVP
ncbi:DNA-formamidopyrimidine glycosylase family protein [Kiritimatiellaeota bacterium B1221]|nr:DNA-formamidopyrimidine glycosylase family protein [Kiritimatiellaeota bacterium B1221]